MTGTESDEAPNAGAWKYWYCVPAVAIAALSIGGGLLTWIGSDSRDEARAACEQVALLRGEGSEVHDVSLEHITGDSYRYEATVETPGLEPEEFNAHVSMSADGSYTCRMDN